MKISEMSTEKAMNVLVELSAPVSAIMGDETIAATIKQIGTPEQQKAPLIATISYALPKLLPAVFAEHKDDLYKVLHLLTDKSNVELANQNVMQTLADIRGCMDKELIDFFSSAAK